MVYVKFEQCDLIYSSLNEIKLKSVEFEQCDLTRSEFYYTSLNNVDLTSNDISAISVTQNDLYGVIVSELQCIELACLFGIRVKQ